MIAIVDYGSGNISAIANIYRRLHIPHVIASTPDVLDDADRVLLPGVGSFDQAMVALNNSGFRSVLDYVVLEKQTPILGICVGMQLFAKSSEEGEIAGLGWVDAEVKRFRPETVTPSLRLPHMGWNDVQPVKATELFRNVDLGNGYYFLHSYYMQCHRLEDVLAVADYGGDFACAVSRDNVTGVQFHPEKSHAAGVQLLKNFAEI